MSAEPRANGDASRGAPDTAASHGGEPRSRPPRSARLERGWATFAPFAGLWLLGTWLRLQHLAAQVLGDDELHAVRVALATPLREILVTYREQDHCIPLTALYRLWLDFGLQPGELELRLPLLLCSLVLLVLPWFARERLGGGAALALQAFVTISPLLVLYGRIVRSYSVIVLLGVIASWAFLRWWEGGARRDAAAFVAAAAAALWFHLASGPFIAVPFVFALFAKLIAARSPAPSAQRSWRQLAWLGLALCAACSLFLLPARESLIALVEAKREAAALTPAVVLEVLQLQSGTGRVWLSAAFWLLALAGLAHLVRSDPSLAGLSGLLFCGQFAGLVLLSPKLGSAVLVARWTLQTLPIALMWAAVGAAALCAAAGRSEARRTPGGGGSLRAGAMAAVAALLCGLVLGGPFASASFRASAFQHHTDALLLTRPRAALAREALPVAYSELAALGPGAIAEAPWHPFWGFNRTFYALQALHGRRVLVANGEAFARDPRIAWRAFVPLSADALLASSARFAVLHMDIERSERALAESLDAERRGRAHSGTWQQLRESAQRANRALEARLGAPTIARAGLRVWDLDAVRAQGAAARNDI